MRRMSGFVAFSLPVALLVWIKVIKEFSCDPSLSETSFIYLVLTMSSAILAELKQPRHADGVEAGAIYTFDLYAG